MHFSQTILVVCGLLFCIHNINCTAAAASESSVNFDGNKLAEQKAFNKASLMQLVSLLKSNDEDDGVNNELAAAQHDAEEGSSDEAQAEEDNEEVSEVKRNPAYLRFGKRNPAYLRFGKRNPAYLRFGKRQPGSYLRFGKRNPAYLRFGRSVDNVEQQ